MQACSNCGATVRDGARFCTACGTQLNEASSGNSAFSWGAAVEQPATPDSAVEEQIATDLTVEEQSTTISDEIEESESSETSDFSWSWDPPATTDGEASTTSLTEADTEEPSETSEPQTSAAEETSDISGSDETAPADSQDTLALWAQDWSTEDEVDDVAEVTSTSVPVVAGEVNDDSDDAEATVEKAERLIAQLQSLIPRLAQPLPAKPQSIVPTQLADELDNLNDGSDWSDLRSVLEQARENPNDINHLMTVSANANRLLSLLDSRENFARTTSDVAYRLRNPEPVDSSDES